MGPRFRYGRTGGWTDGYGHKGDYVFSLRAPCVTFSLVAADQLPSLDGVRAHMGLPADASTRDTKSAVGTALAFVERINAHDVAGLCDLMTEGHVFVDALSNRFEGRETMRGGWEQFFDVFPGYRIDAETRTASGDTVGLFGTAAGRYKDGPKKTWGVAAAWKAVVADGLVAEWRVYCDTAWARRE
jgi:ketosteroid isomerase-like protein